MVATEPGADATRQTVSAVIAGCRRAEDGTLTAEVREDWMQGRSLYGGVQAALATEAMRPFSDGFLDAYINECGEEVLSSVGGYRLEDRGAQLFEKIDGDYFTILGLPLLPLLTFLRQNGALES